MWSSFHFFSRQRRLNLSSLAKQVWTIWNQSEIKSLPESSHLKNLEWGKLDKYNKSVNTKLFQTIVFIFWVVLTTFNLVFMSKFLFLFKLSIKISVQFSNVGDMRYFEYWGQHSILFDQKKIYFASNCNFIKQSCRLDFQFCFFSLLLWSIRLLSFKGFCFRF